MASGLRPPASPRPYATLQWSAASVRCRSRAGAPRVHFIQRRRRVAHVPRKGTERSPTRKAAVGCWRSKAACRVAEPLEGAQKDGGTAQRRWRNANCRQRRRRRRRLDHHCRWRCELAASLSPRGRAAATAATAAAAAAAGAAAAATVADAAALKEKLLLRRTRRHFRGCRARICGVCRGSAPRPARSTCPPPKRRWAFDSSMCPVYVAPSTSQ